MPGLVGYRETKDKTINGKMLCKLLAIRDVHFFKKKIREEPLGLHLKYLAKSLFINSLPIAMHNPSYQQDPLKTKG